MSLIGINSLNAGFDSDDIDCEITVNTVASTLRRYTYLTVLEIGMLNEKLLRTGCLSCVGQLLLFSLVIRKKCTACLHETLKN